MPGLPGTETPPPSAGRLRDSQAAYGAVRNALVRPTPDRAVRIHTARYAVMS